MKLNKVLRKGTAILLIFAVWQFACFKTGNEILLPSPERVFAVLLEEVQKERFRFIILSSGTRICKGFLAAFLAGFVLASLTFFIRPLKDLVKPFLAVLKAIPVASFVVMLLIWTGSGNLAVWISFLVVFPVIYENTLSGYENADPMLEEEARVYQVRLYYKWFYVYRPALSDYLLNAIKVASGMAWKSGVAAELIGTPLNSLGEQLYLSKITIDTAAVFAWTLVIIILGSIFEAVLAAVCRLLRLQKRSLVPPVGRRHKTAVFQRIEGRNLCKKFGEKTVFENYSFSFENHRVIALTGESGIGKTTLFRMITGAELPDCGEIRTDNRTEPVISCLFQENRLCESADAIANVMFLTGRSALQAETELKKLLPADCLKLPVSRLSGGMKRRVLIVAAMCANADLILMDEPLTGLDEKNKRKAADYIKKNRKDRLLLFSTHSIEEMSLMEHDFEIKIVRNA